MRRRDEAASRLSPPSGRTVSGLSVGLLALVLALPATADAGRRPKPPKFTTATNSSPIVLSADGKLLWTTNPDSDTVSVIATKTNAVLKSIPVGDEPQQLAVDPANKYAYVANAASATVTVIRITNPNPNRFKARVAKDLGNRGNFAVGAEPLNIVITPDGRRVYVANAAQDTITVIDATKPTRGRGKGKRAKGRRQPVSPRVIGHRALRGSACSPDPEFHFQPRGLAVTKNSKQLFVTSFFSFQIPGVPQINDEGRQGIVCRLDIDTDATKLRQGLKPIGRVGIGAQNTGFTIDQNGDAVADPTFAWPNQIQSIVIRGRQAYLPNIGASPEGPLRFNVDTAAFLSQINGIGTDTKTDGGSVNLHLGAREPEAGKKRLFFSNPWAVDFTNNSGAGAGYVVSAGSDLLVKVNVGSDGAISFTVDDNTTRYIDLNDPANPATSGRNAGKNPRGIVINKQGTRAYVTNFVSRNVSVVDLTTDTVIGSIPTAGLPPPGSTEEVVQVGAEIFFSSRGRFDRPPGTTVSTDDRLSSEGWQSCSSCHFDGLTDGVVWAFGTGPRKSVPLNASFNPFSAFNPEQKILNYSAIFDEIQDFELNIRNVSGPGNLPAATPCSDPPPATSAFDPNHGLLIGDNGDVDDKPCEIAPFRLKANANRPQLTVTLPGSTTPVPALDAMTEWVRLGIRTPQGPIAGLPGGPKQADVQAGEALFAQQGCANCHGSGLWGTSAVKNFTSPPAAANVFTETNPAPPPGQTPVGAQYLDAFLRNINSFNIGVPGTGNDLGNNIGGVELASSTLNANGAAQPALGGLGRDYNGDGRGIGFAPPALVGIFASPPYYHNGACETLSCVLTDVQHRTGLGASPDLLTNSADREKLVDFLESIDTQ